MAINLAKALRGFEHQGKEWDRDHRCSPTSAPQVFWTIGYGHICDPKHPPITEAEAEVYLARDLQTALAATLRYCPLLATEPERRLAAIIDFHIQPRCRSSADINVAATDQTGLAVGCMELGAGCVVAALCYLAWWHGDKLSFSLLPG